MAATQDLQALLRFLSQDAKLPLALAMSKVKDLQNASLSTPADIAKSKVETLNSIFNDEKSSKQVLSAAKRVSKKRLATGDTPTTPVKKAKPTYGQPMNPKEFEESLELPEICKDEEKLAETVVFTNRAPLVLAFTVTLLKYTMPEQPLSSRLSLAQAVVSANSRTKAVSIGLESGKSAEEEGWGEGQPIVKVMGREVRVMKRWGYQWELKAGDGATQDTLEEQPTGAEEPALWGVDLEKLRQDKGPVTVASRNTATSQLPIYTPQSARSYLLKSFDTPKASAEEETSPAKKKSAGGAAQKERNLGLLLGAVELVYESWSSVLTTTELDSRAWGWYVRVRPEVEAGVAGWGGKGNVKLSDILALRRSPD